MTKEGADTMAAEPAVKSGDAGLHSTSIGSFSGGALAYLGDAVFELAVRSALVRTGISDPGKLNRMALDYVRAGKQSEALDRLLPHLTPTEEALFKRGRNTVGGAHPKSASAVEYRRATGVEALFGGLFLSGEFSRIAELFAIAFPGALTENTL